MDEPATGLWHSPGAHAVREEVETCLRSFLADRAPHPGTHEPALSPELLQVLTGYLFPGGKRLRPLLCVTGWRAAGGRGRPDELTACAAALEMFHTFTLLHDDVMDDSAHRRGRPTAHRALAALHPGRPDADRLGVSGAILLGDLALAWSDRLLRSAGLTPRQLRAAGTVVDAMREATVRGQYADLVTAATGITDERHAMAIARDKTAKYTVEGPLHLGAVLAGADPILLRHLSAFALPLGEAFQLRDDLHAVFEEPGRAGEPPSEDLRDGKCTLLTVLALRRADPAQRDRLLCLLGDRSLDDAGAAEARRLLEATGARRLVEQRVTELRTRARAAVHHAALPPDSAAELLGWADHLTTSPSRPRHGEDDDQGFPP
ncbi:polyprenyl synthetase family protein [Streptomyces sp. NPDC006197]|uniref:polyprenyl synthetase family protein n=1 Tax=Streptomyces sp. NPDC006197 TaxID=3156685 RepID=UPI0033BA4905